MPMVVLYCDENVECCPFTEEEEAGTCVMGYYVKIDLALFVGILY